MFHNDTASIGWMNKPHVKHWHNVSCMICFVSVLNSDNKACSLATALFLYTLQNSTNYQGFKHGYKESNPLLQT